ncbi:class II D-tagatose-bisphosphate aldolase, non-catalytic subunit [Granulicella mallensis]|uniref:class II D-tagatose-bisphosphate aldolase, non-catalytic subunit n=1 Tax=Granulicella mallensis TaxID=940614 RepID=UPI0012373EA2|nr:class II D-tagatose-bisphosphate aldolase, non-catalytic subunit [Granulicella mallensis]
MWRIEQAVEAGLLVLVEATNGQGKSIWRLSQSAAYNLSRMKISESMSSRYLPIEYCRLGKQEIASDPVSLIIDLIGDIKNAYTSVCSKGIDIPKLFKATGVSNSHRL